MADLLSLKTLAIFLENDSFKSFADGDPISEYVELRPWAEVSPEDKYRKFFGIWYLYIAEEDCFEAYENDGEYRSWAMDRETGEWVEN